MRKFGKRECKKGTSDSVGRAGRSAAGVFRAMAAATALALAVPGCAKPGEKEKSAEQLKTEEEMKGNFIKLLNEKAGHSTDIYTIVYPDTFMDMLSSPFDKEDGISYKFIFRGVRQEEVLDVVRGLKEALDAHYLESDMPLIKDDKTYRISYKTELQGIHYEIEKDGKGSLEVSVQFERMEEPVKKKGKSITAHR